ncbi:hypothetical protein HUJ05_006950 [Dendroctonus ponderosae]|nr:hypothetical protein HUJ05_006950 [Dendroctonus ponderosae]
MTLFDDSFPPGSNGNSFRTLFTNYPTTAMLNNQAKASGQQTLDDSAPWGPINSMEFDSPSTTVLRSKFNTCFFSFSLPTTSSL